MKKIKNSLIICLTFMLILVNSIPVSAANSYDAVQYAYIGNNKITLKSVYTYDDNGNYTYKSIRGIVNTFNKYSDHFESNSVSYEINSSRDKCTIVLDGYTVSNGYVLNKEIWTIQFKVMQDDMVYVDTEIV